MALGAYGVAIIAMTIGIRLVLAPLQQFQLITQRKSMAEQRKLAPQVAELRKKYKKDTQRQNQEIMKLYQEHGVNPLGGLVGCLPLLVQMPILSALYFVFRFRAPSLNLPTHFLFVPNLNDIPTQHGMFAILGLSIPIAAYLIFPLLAALTTYVQAKMLQMPPPLNPTEQELQTLQIQRSMVFISPLMIGYFALTVPVALALYWFVGNCVGIIQQSFVVGWGNVLPARFRTVAGGAPSGPSKLAGNKPVSDNPSSNPKSGPPGPSNRPNKPKKPKR
ncbi:MAG TPA: YidC/Oxa1 family membrane protein insertase [Candidatus Dormibacteraeota bacterium]|nr:YidC/Oxa1 family membrane protein insertase [Candidatus Dormibacteraeota bacterium]